MGYRFKGLPTRTVEDVVLPDSDAYEGLGLDVRCATSEHPADLGTGRDDIERLMAGQEVQVRETVAAGEPGAGPIEEEMVVVEWNPVEDPDTGETIHLRAMSFTQPQFDALFEGVK